MITIAEIVNLARFELTDPNSSEWSDDELGRYCLSAVRDVWRDITPLHEDFFARVTDGSTARPYATLPASSARGGSIVTGVIESAYKITVIEPVGFSTFGLDFEPRAYNSSDAQRARRDAPVSPTSGDTIFYSLLGSGPSTGTAPQIHCAPSVGSDVSLTYSYVESIEGFIGAATSGGNSGRSSSGDLTAAKPSGANVFALVDYVVPEAGEGQVLLAHTNTTIFRWDDLLSATLPDDGDDVTGMNTGLRLPVVHAGAPAPR